MGDNNNIIKNTFLQQYNNINGEKFSFTPDEANVDDLAKACVKPIIYSVLLRIKTLRHQQL